MSEETIMINHFVKDKSEYKRNINVLQAYYKDMATYLNKMTGKPIEECFQYVKSVTSKDGKFPLQDPKVLCLSKEKEGEREKRVMSFSEYMQDIVDRKDLCAPTFTTYIHPRIKKSLLSLYISGNLKKRSKLKKESLAAKMAKNIPLHNLRENQQNSAKIKNNALSGAHASNGTPLANKSSHSTLTSVCRSATAYGNANNEKFISGNRHYWCPDIVIANIISIINTVDLYKIADTIKCLNLRHPTAKETLAVVKYSTDLYWKNPEELKRIEALIDKLSDVERSAFVYCGDFYHIAKYNDSFCRKMISDFIKKPTEFISIEESKKYLKEADNDLIAYVSLLSKEKLKGMTLNDALEKQPEVYQFVGSVTKNVLNNLDKYQDFIKAFFVVNTVPASVASLPSSIRRSALASDTDSTIFTTQEWVKWYTNEYAFSDTASSVAVTITYLTSQVIIHILATMSANIGVDKEDINRLQMKNEYSFPVFVLTPKAKHYYASIDAREGNVYDHLEKEIKGVGLRSSNCPPAVMKQVHDMMDYIMKNIIAGKKVSLDYCYNIIATIENNIRKSVEDGKYEYLTRSRINAKDAYKNPNSSAYVYYELWEEVFSPKYGVTEPPPYTAIKVSLITDNKTKLKEWTDGIKDPGIKKRLIEFITKKGKNDISTFLLPESVISASGVPKEIIDVIDIRNLIYDTVKPFYSILESLGIFMIDDNVCRLISDFYKPK